MKKINVIHGRCAWGTPNSDSLIISKPAWIGVFFPLKKSMEAPNRVSEHTLKSRRRLCCCLYCVLKMPATFSKHPALGYSFTRGDKKNGLRLLIFLEHLFPSCAKEISQKALAQQSTHVQPPFHT